MTEPAQGSSGAGAGLVNQVWLAASVLVFTLGLPACGDPELTIILDVSGTAGEPPVQAEPDEHGIYCEQPGWQGWQISCSFDSIEASYAGMILEPDPDEVSQESFVLDEQFPGAIPC